MQVSELMPSKMITVLYEFEDVRQFGIEVVEADSAKDAAQKAFEAAAENNDWELTPGESWINNQYQWRLVLVFQGEIDPAKQMLWGDSCDPRSENFNSDWEK
jgi:hypothetical protein